MSIFPLLKSKHDADRTVLITQYRPPVDAYVVEFPAGLIDAGESAEIAALRELKEETGYTGTLKKCTDIMVSDPGMTNANMKLAIVHV